MNRSPSPKTFFNLLGENVWLVLLFGLPAVGGLFGHLAKWSPGELEVLVAILVAAVIAAMTLYFWHRVRLAQADAALKQSMLQRGLTPDEIERLLCCQSGPPEEPPTEERAIEEVAACLRKSNVSVAAMEQVFTAMRIAEPPTRQALLSAIRGLAGEWGNSANEKAVLAVVRGLCGNGGRPATAVPSPTTGDRRARRPKPPPAPPPAVGVPSATGDEEGNEDIVAIRAKPGPGTDRPRD
jgi:hypothetical protein